LKVIDTLGHGFQSVARRWWLILIPILLDSFLWLGPQVSVQNLAQEAIQTFEVELSALPAEGLDEWFDILAEALEEASARYNTLSTLRVGMLGVPSLLIWGGARLGSPSAYEGLWVSFLRTINMSDMLLTVPRAEFAYPAVWQVQQQGTWLLLVFGLSLLGIAIGSIYLTTLWPNAEGDAERPPFWARVGKLGLRFLLFWLLRALVVALLGIPFVFALALLNLMSPELALLFASITLGLATWLSFYGTFVLASMVVNDATVLRAIWNSIGVVLRNFWPTLWLFILINLIGGGLTILWQQISHGAWTGLAIVGNAYVGTSLIAASLLFYQDRYTSWQEALAELLAKQEKQTT
jgi:hypothetical protein